MYHYFIRASHFQVYSEILLLIIEICSEPVKKGRCNSNILRFYFDKQTGRCHVFSYSGCDGNRNNFSTDKDCNNICGNFQSKLIRLLFSVVHEIFRFKTAPHINTMQPTHVMHR